MAQHKKLTRFLAWTLTVMMAVGNVPTNVFAASDYDVVVDGDSDDYEVTVDNGSGEEEVVPEQSDQSDEQEEAEESDETSDAGSNEADTQVIQPQTSSPGSSSDAKDLQTQKNGADDASAKGETKTDSTTAVQQKSEFASKRLIVGTSNKSVIKDTDKLLANFDTIYLLQYNTEEETKAAYNSYKKTADFVEADAEVETADTTSANGDVDVSKPMTKDDNPLTNAANALQQDSEDVANGTIALIDTGVKTKDNNVKDAVSVIDDSWEDQNGHGSDMAKDIVSQNPKAQILSIKALGSNGKGTLSSIVAALKYAQEKGAKYVNLSMSANKSVKNSALEAIVNQLVDDKITVVGAAGNDGSDAANYVPGCIKKAYVIGASDKDGIRINSSNYGDTVDYYVSADSTSEAAAKFTGYISKNGVKHIQTNEKDGLIFTTDYQRKNILNDTIVDTATEAYIEKNADPQYIPKGDLSLITLMDVQQTLYDNGNNPTCPSLNEIMQNVDSAKGLLGSIKSIVPVYQTTADSNYYVAKINTMQSDDAPVQEVIFAHDNVNGEVVDGCIYDKNTGLAYIPKSLYFVDGYKNGKPAWIQAQLLHTYSLDRKSSFNVSVLTKDVQKSDVQSDTPYTMETNVNIGKNIPKSASVAVNGIKISANHYYYDKKTGNLKIGMSSAAIDSISVTNLDTMMELKLKTSDDDDSFKVAASQSADSIGYYDNTTTLNLPNNVNVGDEFEGYVHVNLSLSTAQTPNKDKNVYTVTGSTKDDGDVNAPSSQKNAQDTMSSGGNASDKVVQNKNYYNASVSFSAPFTHKPPNGTTLDLSALGTMPVNCVHISADGNPATLQSGASNSPTSFNPLATAKIVSKTATDAVICFTIPLGGVAPQSQIGYIKVHTTNNTPTPTPPPSGDTTLRIRKWTKDLLKNQAAGDVEDLSGAKFTLHYSQEKIDVHQYTAVKDAEDHTGTQTGGITHWEDSGVVKSFYLKDLYQNEQYAKYVRNGQPVPVSEISGAESGLHDSSGTMYKYEISDNQIDKTIQATTDKDGVAKFAGIPSNASYYIEETDPLSKGGYGKFVEAYNKGDLETMGWDGKTTPMFIKTMDNQLSVAKGGYIFGNMEDGKPFTDGKEIKDYEYEVIEPILVYHNLEIVKDSVKGGEYGDATLAGAEFKVQNVSKNPIEWPLGSGRIVKPNEFLKRQEDGTDRWTDIFRTTEKDKSFRVEGLTYGTYKVYEVTPPEGFMADPEYSGGKEFVLHGSDGSGKVSETKNGTVKEPIIRSRITVSKVDEQTGKKFAQLNEGDSITVQIINGSKAAIYAGGSSTEQGGEKVAPGGVADTLTLTYSKSSGWSTETSKYLDYGTYTVREVPTDRYANTDYASTHYGKDDDKTIQLHGSALEWDKDANGGIGEWKFTGSNITFKNSAVRADIQLTKIDDNENEHMKNVPFLITNLRTGEQHVAVTDDSGYFSSQATSRNRHSNLNDNDKIIDALANAGYLTKKDQNKSEENSASYYVVSTKSEAKDVVKAAARNVTSLINTNAGIMFLLSDDDKGDQKNITATSNANDLDAAGALVEGEYRIDELPCESNMGYSLYTNGRITVKRKDNGSVINFGTVPNKDHPWITTEARSYDTSYGEQSFDEYGDHVADANGTQNITDRVYMHNLVPGKTYRLKATMYVMDREAKLNDDDASDLNTIYTPIGHDFYSENFVADKADDQTQDVDLLLDMGAALQDATLKSKTLAGKTIVIHEELQRGYVYGEKEYDEDKEKVDEDGFKWLTVAKHTDEANKDEKQKIHVPQIRTHAIDTTTGDHVGANKNASDNTVTINDTVTYKNLIGGKDYTIRGKVFKVTKNSDGSYTNDDEAVAEQELNFTTPDAPVDTVDTERQTSVAVDGREELTFTFDDEELTENQSYVVYEYLYDDEGNGKLIARHEDPTDEEQLVHYPKIRTHSKDDSTRQVAAAVIEGKKSTDTVDYWNLVIGEQYYLRAMLMNQKTGELMYDAKGKPVIATKIFTPSQKDGSVEVVFDNFDMTNHAADTGIVFETLYHRTRDGLTKELNKDIQTGTGKEWDKVKDTAWVPIAIHQDLNDESQSMHYPEIGTELTDVNSGTHAGVVYNNTLEKDKKNGKTTLRDTVYFWNLVPGITYRMQGILMDKENHQAINTRGNKATDDKDLRPVTSSVRFTVDEDISETKDDTWKIKDEDGNVIGEVTAKPTRNESQDYEDENGKTISGTHGYVNGYVKLYFDIDASNLENKTTVAFETLYSDNGTLLRTHNDFNDEAQAVHFPKIRTTATDAKTGDDVGTNFELNKQNGLDRTNPGGDITVNDKVSFWNLIPGHKYTVTGHMMDKDTGKAASKDVSVTFTVPTKVGQITDITGAAEAEKQQVTDIDTEINKAKGYVTLQFTYKGEEDHSYVAYEKLYDAQEPSIDSRVHHPSDTSLDNGQNTPDNDKLTKDKDQTHETKELTQHEDIKDHSQTVNYPKIRTTATNLKTTDDKADHVGTIDQNDEETTKKETTFIDTVYYRNLVKGRQYQMHAVLMDKATGQPFLINGQKVEKTVTFTADDAIDEQDDDDAEVKGLPSDSTVAQHLRKDESDDKTNRVDGNIKISFTVPSDTLAGKTLVAFEDLSHNGVIVAVHAVISDEKQTVHYPDFRTTAMDSATTHYEDMEKDHTDEYDYVSDKEDIVKGNTKADEKEDYSNHAAVVTKVKGTKATIIDRVHFQNLIPGQTYTMKGTLMEKIVDKNGNINSKQLTDNDDSKASRTFTIPEYDGKDDVKLTNDDEGHYGSVHYKVYSTDDQNRYADGYVDLVFEVDSSALEEKTAVAFEQMYHNKKLIRIHEDITDEDQTVHYPKIRTNIYDEMTKDRVGTNTYWNDTDNVNADGQNPKSTDTRKLVDTVTFDNLIPGKTYRLTGTLMQKVKDPKTGEWVIDKETGKAKAEVVKQNGKTITTTRYFTVPNVTQIGVYQDKEHSYDGLDTDITVTKVDSVMRSISGKINLTFDYLPEEGETYVAYEKLFSRDVEITRHEEIEDEPQTQHFPKIRTTAYDMTSSSHGGTVAGKSTIIDTVHFWNLIPGEKYTLKAQLMNKDTGEPLLAKDKDGNENPVYGSYYRFNERTGLNDSGNQPDVKDLNGFTKITSDDHLIEFTPKSADGEIDVAFVMDTTSLTTRQNRPVTTVAYEDLYHNGIDIAWHHHIKDEPETIHYPWMHTTATDKYTGTHAGTTTVKDENEKQNTTVKDHVVIKNLVVGQEYVLTGKLMDKETGKRLGNPENPNQSYDVLTRFKVTETKGKTEDLYEVQPGLLGSIADSLGINRKKIGTITGSGETSYTWFDEGSDTVKKVAIDDHYANVTVDLELPLDTTNLGDKTAVVFENLYIAHDGLNSEEAITNDNRILIHENLNDADQTVHYPKVQTLAWDENTNDHVGTNAYGDSTEDGTANKDYGSKTSKDDTALSKDQIEDVDTYGANLWGNKTGTTDTVYFENVIPGVKYVMKGWLVDKATGERVTDVHEQAFTVPETPNTKTAESVGKRNGTKSEVLDDKTRTQHEALEDENGKTIGTVWTRTEEKRLADNTPTSIGSEGLDKDKNYQNKQNSDGSYEAKYDGNGNVVAARCDGTVDISFDDFKGIEGHTYVAYEELYNEGQNIAEHKDINDEKETQYFPKIRTTNLDTNEATHAGTVTKTAKVVDTVHFWNLIPGQEYALTGYLMDQKTGQPVLVDGQRIYPVQYVYNNRTGDADKNGVKQADQDDHTKKDTDTEDPANGGYRPTSVVRFTPKTANGDIQLIFNVPSKDLAHYDGATLVAYEELYHPNLFTKADILVAYHRDLHDERQSVHYPWMHTTATDLFTKTHAGTAYANGMSSENAADFTTEVVDRVDLHNLKTNQEYVLRGTLMDKKTGKAIGDPTDPNEDYITEIRFIVPDTKGKTVAVEDVDGHTTVESKIKGQEARAYGTWKGNGSATTSDTYADGVITLAFPINSAVLGDRTAVVFEDLYIGKEAYDNDKRILIHHNIDDADQSVHYPKIRTHLFDDSTLDDVGTNKYGTKTETEGNTKEENRDLGKYGPNKYGEKTPVTDTVTYNNVIPGLTYTIKGWLVDKATGKKVEGTDVMQSFVVPEQVGTDKVKSHEGEEVEALKDASGNVIGGVTERRDDQEQADHTKITNPDGSVIKARADGYVDIHFTNLTAIEKHTYVAYEELWQNGAEIAEHKDINDQKQTVQFPKIRTTAVDKINGTHTAEIGKSDVDNDDNNAQTKQTIVDTIHYWNLVPGKEYKVTGVLMNKATGEEYTQNGKRILPKYYQYNDRSGDDDQNGLNEVVNEDGSVDFTPQHTNGDIKLYYELNSESMQGMTIVVYEDLYHNNIEVAYHHEITDENQTIHYPWMHTTAKDIHSYEKDITKRANHPGAEDGYNGDETHVGTVNEDPKKPTAVMDAVEFKNLVPGMTYTLRGVVIDRKTGAPLINREATRENQEYRDIIRFVIPEEAGEAKLKDTNGNVVGDVTVVNNKEQCYADGTVHLSFVINAQEMEEVTAVVYEYLYVGKDAFDEDNRVLLHEDIHDEDQTIHFPKIRTNANDKIKSERGDADKEVLASYEEQDRIQTIIDTVSWNNLIPGETYTLEGTLMDKDTGEDLKTIEGNTITAKRTFTVPKTADEKLEDGMTVTNFDADNNFVDGTIDITFTFVASGLEGKTAVAYEDLYNAGWRVAFHRDINDEKQTDRFPKIETKAADSETKIDEAVAKSDLTITDQVTYRNLEKGEAYTVKGYLMDKETGKQLMIGGKPVTAEKKFIAQDVKGRVNLDFTFDAHEILGKTCVVFEDLYHDGKHVATHHDIDDEEQDVHYPQLKTNALDKESQMHEAQAKKDITIKDRVTYKNLHTGTYQDEEGNTKPYEYTIKGMLMDKETGNPLLVDGKPVTAEQIFRPTKPSGYIDLEFHLDASALEGKTVVAFEDLYRLGKDIAIHHEITDEDQSVHIPKIRTTLKDTKTLDHVGKAEKQVEIKDAVKYWNLLPGHTYTVKGTLMVKGKETTVTDLQDTAESNAETAASAAETAATVSEDTVSDNKEDVTKRTFVKNDQPGTTTFTAEATPLLDKNGKPITAEAKFTVGKDDYREDGQIVLTFKFDASLLQGKTVVAFEKMYDEKYLVAVHEDITDEDQSLHYPEIRTNATDGTSKAHEGQQSRKMAVVDRVTYKNLIPGKTYTLNGTLMEKTETAILKRTQAKKLMIDGKPVTATLDFVPDKADGYVDLTFTFDGSKLAGKTAVAYEKLYLGKTEIAVHEDITDEDQTVKIINIRTNATAENGLHETGDNSAVTITDRVTYTNLTVGKKYTMNGKLMDKSTGLPALQDGKEITASVTFVPKKADGYVDLMFHVNGTTLAGKHLVTYEDLVYDKKTIAVHHDLTDKDQTVSIVSIQTNARDSVTNDHQMTLDDKAVLVDAVTYTGLTAGDTYTLKGDVVARESGESIGAKAEKTFVAKEPNGTEELEFTLNTNDLQGRTLVVFEELYDASGNLIVDHKNPNDRQQIVTVPYKSKITVHLPDDDNGNDDNGNDYGYDNGYDSNGSNGNGYGVSGRTSSGNGGTGVRTGSYTTPGTTTVRQRKNAKTGDNQMPFVYGGAAIAAAAGILLLLLKKKKKA